MKKFLHHGIYHYFFVAGVGVLQDLVAGLIGVVLLILGVFIFQTISQDLIRAVFGLPLVLIGMGIVVINLFGIYSYLFDKNYSLVRCPFCRR